MKCGSALYVSERTFAETLCLLLSRPYASCGEIARSTRRSYKAIWSVLLQMEREDLVFPVGRMRLQPKRNQTKVYALTDRGAERALKTEVSP